jgi:hypothetical protein
MAIVMASGSPSGTATTMSVSACMSIRSSSIPAGPRKPAPAGGGHLLPSLCSTACGYGRVRCGSSITVVERTPTREGPQSTLEYQRTVAYASTLH